MLMERYSTEKMRAIWSEMGTMSLWSTVERVMAQAQGAPEEVVEELLEKRLPTKEVGVREWKEEEAVTKHDVAAFVKLVRESVSPEAARWVHLGVTSSDLVDSAQAIRVKESLGMVHRATTGLVEELGQLARRTSGVAWVGRTHGQWAQETEMGHLWSNRAMLVQRAGLRVTAAMAEQRVMMSGPVGDYRTMGGPKRGRAAEAEFGRLVKMPVAAKTTQVVARDGLAEAMWSCERVMAAIAQVAMDVRLMGQSEVGEVAEAFGPNQKGSSIMAHKNNTIRAENLVGLERVVRANVMPVVEGVGNMWGMRDISHSAVERVSVPLVLGLTEFAALRAAALVKGLVVNREAIAANVERTGGLLAAGPLVTWLTQEGADPEAAWQAVHVASQRVKDEGRNLIQTTHSLVNRLVKDGARGWGKFEGNWADWS